MQTTKPPTPLVSVVLPVRNGMPYLREAVHSILGQTLKSFELLAIDDGSTDDTARFLLAIGDTRVRYLRLAGSGICDALNCGLRQAQAPFVARMDADDIAEPQRLEKQIAFLQARPEVGIVGCQSLEIDFQGKPLKERRFPVRDDAIRWQMAFGCPLQHPAVMYRPAEVVRAGGYQSRDLPTDDFGLWVRMIGNCKFANLPDRLLQYRIHATSVTTTRLAEMKQRCSALAASYVASVDNSIDSAAFAALYRFVSDGILPVEACIEDLVLAFLRWRSHFTSAHSGSDLKNWMTHIQQRLRWHCLEHAARCRWNPVAAWRWVRLAGRFDPENGTLSRIAKRALLSAFRRPSVELSPAGSKFVASAT